MKDPEKQRELWDKHIKALREGKTEESWRIFTEEYRPDYKERYKASIDDMFEQLGRQIESKMWRGKKQPNLPRCVLATLEELKAIGVWDGENNSTYGLTVSAIEAYNKAEKKRVEYLAMKKALRNASDDYLITLNELAINLIIKDLTPLSGTITDPLKWYLSALDLVKMFNKTPIQSKGQDIKTPIKVTVPTLRKYQALGLVPKPIRLGRKSYYSYLTLIRLAIIDDLKKRGYKLSDMKRQLVDEALQETLKYYGDKYPRDRSQLEMLCLQMVKLESEYMVELLLEMKGAEDKPLDKDGES